MPEVSKTQATKLKDEGNAFFAKRQYSRAYDKYTQAIHKDGENAVLYTNRAACQFMRKKYLDSANDAKKATELDPLYHKAWARHASALEALENWPTALSSWSHALEALPTATLTPSELKQKEEYTTKIAHAAAKSEEQKEVTGVGSRVDGAGMMWKQDTVFPWLKARAIVEKMNDKEFESGTSNSSVWVIYKAFEDFAEGVDDMLCIENVRGVFVGKTGAISKIVTGIIRDRRIFHMGNTKWLLKYEQQVAFEAAARGAWTEGGPEVVLKEAQERLEVQGWDRVRPALSLTVNAWILKGWLLSCVKRNDMDALPWYGYAIDVLQQGQKIWKNVPREERGVSFDDGFIVGLTALRLQSYMNVCFAKSKAGRDKEYPLKNLMELSDDVIDSAILAKKNLSHMCDSGFYLSCFVYTLAEGYITKAMCLRKKARYHSASADESQETLRFAANLYMEAASLLPEDEENKSLYMGAGLVLLWRLGAPLSETLPKVASILAYYPKMRRIWENSQLSIQGQHDSFKLLYVFAKSVEEDLKAGKVTLESDVHPDWIFHPQLD